LTAKQNSSRTQPPYQVTSSKKSITAWLALGLAGAALFSLAAGLVFPLKRQFGAILQHTYVMVIAMDTLSHLEEAEAGENGYLVTGEVSYLESFNTSYKALDEEVDRLRELAKLHPEKTHQVENLQYLVHQELLEFQTTVATRAMAGFDIARSRVRTGRAKQLMSAIRVDLRTLVLEEQSEMGLFSRRTQSRLWICLAALIGSGLLCGCILLAGRIVLARNATLRRNAEEELQASERRFETLCEQAPLGIYATDPEGRCIYTNRSWSSMSGLSANESLGHGWKAALHPDDRERVFHQWKAAARQGTTWEYRLLNTKGQTRWIRAVGAPIYSAQGTLTGYVGTLEDVTERKQAGERFRLVFEATPSGMLMVDYHGKIVLVNSQTETLFGYERKELLGRSIEILVPEVFREKHVGLCGEYLVRPGARRMGAGRELTARRKDGTQFPVEIGLNPIETEQGTMVVSSILDITERKRAEDTVRQAFQQLQLITDNMPAGVTRCSRDHRYLWVSRSYAAWLGLAPEQVVGRPIPDVIGRDGHKILLPYVERVLSGQRVKFETQITYPGIGARWISTVYVPTKDSDDKVDGWIGVVADVTERHEAQEQLRESEERFRNMANAAPVMIWMAGPDKLCNFFNNVWLEFTGRSMEQELGNGWVESVHPDDLERCMATYSTSFEAHRHFRMEYRLRRADGEYRWLLDDGVPRFTSGDVFAGYIGSCIDITDRRRAEEERQKFVSLADRSPEFIGMWDLNFRPFYVNSAGMRLIGLDNLEAACQFKVRDYYFPEDQAFVIHEFFPRVLREGHGTIEIRFRHFKTGGAIWMLCTVFSICDIRGEKVGWATVSVDVTERRRAEEKLREALQQIQLITDNMPAAVIRCSHDQRYLWINRTYTTWLGRTLEQIAGRPVWDVVGREDYEELRPHIEKVLSGQRDEFETRITFLAGGPRWIHVIYVPTTGIDNEVGGWIALVSDVTDRHEAEVQLRQSEERFRVTFLQAGVGIAQTTLDGQWLLLNDRFCEIVGHTRNELREKTFIDITHPEDRELSLEAKRKLLAGEISLWSSEKRYIRTDGVAVWARVFVSLVRDQNNDPQYFVAVVEDITAQKEAERALQRSRQELRALAGRLINAEEDERKRISRELHDDLCQKLALLAFDTAGLVLAPPPTVEEIKEPLRILESRMVKMADDVRQLSHRLHPSVLEDLGLTAALNELCEEFSAREGIEVAFEQRGLPKALPVNLAACLYRISQEALHNVLKHAQATQITLGLVGESEGIHLYIRDNGVGFDQEESRPGLGIVSMKERVRLVQGEFSIHSQPGKGSEVEVFIPLVREGA
jgi:PAS domain S-box-containing protein